MCFYKLTKLLRKFVIWIQDRRIENRILEELEEQDYLNSTEPNITYQIKKSEREKVVRLLEFKFAFLGFLGLIISITRVNLNRIIQASSSYILVMSIFIALASGYVLVAVFLVFAANREVDDLVLNKSYLLITLEILVAIFLVLGLLVEGIFIFDLAIYLSSSIPVTIGIIYLFTPVRVKKEKKIRDDNQA